MDLNDKAENAAGAHDKRVYVPPTLCVHGALAELTRLSNGSGTGKFGLQADGRSTKS